MCPCQEVESSERGGGQLNGPHRQAEAKLRVSLKRSEWRMIGNTVKIAYLFLRLVCEYSRLLLESVTEGWWVTREWRCDRKEGLKDHWKKLLITSLNVLFFPNSYVLRC